MSGVEVDEEELQLEISKLKQVKSPSLIPEHEPDLSQVLASASQQPQPDYYEVMRPGDLPSLLHFARRVPHSPALMIGGRGISARNTCTATRAAAANGS